jgi:hypothetical protein
MSLMFLWTCCNALVEATEQLEGAAARILDPAAEVASEALSRRPPGAAELRRASDAGGGGGGGAAGAVAAGVTGGGGGWLAGRGGWLVPLLELLALVPTWQHLRAVLGRSLPRALSSRAGERGRARKGPGARRAFPCCRRRRTRTCLVASLRRPQSTETNPVCLAHPRPAALRAALADAGVQAALKFFLATATVLVLTLALSASDPLVRGAQPIFGFVATCVAMQPRVEATADKVGGDGFGRGGGGRRQARQWRPWGGLAAA